MLKQNNAEMQDIIAHCRRLSTSLIQRGSLKKGSILVAGTAWAKVSGFGLGLKSSGDCYVPFLCTVLALFSASLRSMVVLILQ